MTNAGVITVGVDPFVSLGPVTLAWHGIMTAVGLLVGGWLAARSVRARGLDPGHVYNAVLVVALAAIVGARLFFLALEEPSSLLDPLEWIGWGSPSTAGFSSAPWRLPSTSAARGSIHATSMRSPSGFRSGSLSAGSAM